MMNERTNKRSFCRIRWKDSFKKKMFSFFVLYYLWSMTILIADEIFLVFCFFPSFIRSVFFLQSIQPATKKAFTFQHYYCLCHYCRNSQFIYLNAIKQKKRSNFIQSEYKQIKTKQKKKNSVAWFLFLLLCFFLFSLKI